MGEEGVGVCREQVVDCDEVAEFLLEFAVISCWFFAGGELNCVASRLSFGALGSRNSEDLFTTEFAEGTEAEVGIDEDAELPCARQTAPVRDSLRRRQWYSHWR